MIYICAVFTWCQKVNKKDREMRISLPAAYFEAGASREKKRVESGKIIFSRISRS